MVIKDLYFSVCLIENFLSSENFYLKCWMQLFRQIVQPVVKVEAKFSVGVNPWTWHYCWGRQPSPLTSPPICCLVAVWLLEKINSDFPTWLLPSLWKEECWKEESLHLNLQLVFFAVIMSSSAPVILEVQWQPSFSCLPCMQPGNLVLKAFSKSSSDIQRPSWLVPVLGIGVVSLCSWVTMTVLLSTLATSLGSVRANQLHFTKKWEIKL